MHGIHSSISKSWDGPKRDFKENESPRHGTFPKRKTSHFQNFYFQRVFKITFPPIPKKTKVEIVYKNHTCQRLNTKDERRTIKRLNRVKRLNFIKRKTLQAQLGVATCT